MKLLEENIEVNLYDCVRQSPLRYYIKSTNNRRRKKDIRRHQKLRPFVLQRTPSRKWKNMDWEKNTCKSCIW